jgi:putative ABC transport system ATP-binding protein
VTLELRDVVRHYEVDGKVVRGVQGVSLTVAAGEVLAIYGPSGSGKSTLLHVASGLLVPESGVVTLDGVDLGSVSGDDAADFRLEHVGLVLHPYRLMPGHPAVENAAMKLILKGVPVGEARRQGDRWLRRVGLDEKRDKRPAQLSAGEQQRVALVRALMDAPRLVVADEPTAHLDRRKGREVLGLLREVAREQESIVLVATHDVEAVELFDRTLHLLDGELVDAPLSGEHGVSESASAGP